MKKHQINEQTRSRLQKLAGINEIKIVKPQGLVAKISVHPQQVPYKDIEEFVIEEWINGIGNIYTLIFKGIGDQLEFEIISADKGSGMEIYDFNSGDLAGFFYSNFEQLIDNVFEPYGIEYKQLNVMSEPALRVSVEEMLKKGISFSYNGEILNFSKYKSIKDNTQ